MSVFFSGNDLVEIAMGIERNGLAFYESLAKSTENVSVKNLWKYLAGEEKKHVEVFQSMLKPQAERRPPEDYDEEAALYLKALIDSRVFTDDKVARDMAQKATEAEAIQIAINAEKDSILFYSEMSDLARRLDREVIDEIINQEKSHLQQLSELKEKLRSQGRNYKGAPLVKPTTPRVK